LILSSIVSPTSRLLVPGILVLSSRSCPVSLFIDSGADNCFIDFEFATNLGLSLVPLDSPIRLCLADGLSSTLVKYKVEDAHLKIGNHSEKLCFFVINLPSQIILGFPWLQKHNPLIDWRSDSLTFTSEYCQKSCSEIISLSNAALSSPVLCPVPEFNSVSCSASVEKSLLFPLLVPDAISSQSRLVPDEESLSCRVPEESSASVSVSSEKSLPHPAVLLASMQFSVYPYIEVSPESVEPVPTEILSKFPDVFSKSKADTLPPHRPYDCRIDLVPEARPCYAKPYNLTCEEDQVMKSWIDENLSKGFIRPSTSPFGSPCFFVKKKDGSLRMCMDYRGLNAITIKDRNPIPRISDLLRALSKGKIFTTLDLRGAYNLLRIRENDEYKTAFTTKYGLFEFLVMPFGLSNAPPQFQTMMNHFFREQIGKYVLVYLDDIVIYSDNEEEHSRHIHEVLSILSKNNLCCKPEKCHFYRQTVRYLGYIISSKGISMDPEKVRSIQDWPIPTSVRDIQVFLGFCNFYRNLISHYSDLAQPLTSLLKKGVPFRWTPETQSAFQNLKAAFLSSEVLAHPNEERPFILETDASDFALGAVLSQAADSGVAQPVAFYSRQMVPAERNYEIYDKELLAIVESLKHWRHYLQGSRSQIQIICDHKNLEYFMTSKRLTRRQARWSLLLADYDFKIFYRPGVSNTTADPLSRRPDYEVPIEECNEKTLLDPSLFHVANVSTSLQDSYDPSIDWPLAIADYLESAQNEWPSTLSPAMLSLCQKELPYFKFKNDTFVRILSDGISTASYLCAADRPQTIKYFHEALAHLKCDSIFDLIARRYWWPNMKKEIKEFIATCPQCQLNRSNNLVYAPLPPKPIPPTALPFERWGIDFVGPLPETKNGNKYILTAIDYATRWVLGVPVPKMDESAVSTFLYQLMMTFGAPYEVFSDRGKSFLAEGIAAFERDNNITHIATSPYHPQTNGMVERMHAMLGDGLRSLVNGKPERWDEYLPQVLFAIRTRKHAVTGHSPFYLLFGVHPRLPIDDDPPRSTLKPLDELEKLEDRLEFQARTLDELGQARAAANIRSKIQADKIRRRHNFDETSGDYHFKVGDWVKMKHHGSSKLEFNWKGPYHVVDVGFPGTYWLMTPQGLRLDSTVNQSDLAPWLSQVEPNQDFFYDGTTRSNLATGAESF